MIKLSKLFRKKCPFERIKKRYVEIIGSLIALDDFRHAFGYGSGILFIADINSGHFTEKQKMADFLGVPVQYIWPDYKPEKEMKQ
jgi:hypothetical protein